MDDNDIRGLIGSVQDYLVRGGLDEDARYVLGPHAYEGLSKFASLANFIGPGADVKDIASESSKVMEGDPAAFVGLPAALAMMAVPGSKSGVEEAVEKSSEGLSGLRWYRGTNDPSEVSVVSGGKEGVLGGGGVYLTPDPEAASRYATETITGTPKTGGFVLPLTAKFDNPLVVELNKEKGYFAEGRVLEELGMSREKAFDKAEKALETKGSLTNEVKSKAMKAGHDGVILLRDGKLQEAISYRPDDIRSVFGEGSQAIDDIIDNLTFEAEVPGTIGSVKQIAKKLEIDNPGGSWLQDKKEEAAEAMAKAEPNTYRKNLGTTAITGYHEGVIELDPKQLADVPGAMGEELHRTSGQKLANLQKSIEQEGYNPSPIMIHVREDGKPFIVEGNTRVAEAIISDRPTIQAEIKYLRGAEEVEGPLSPDKIFEIPDRAKSKSNDLKGYRSGGRIERNPYNYEPKAI